MKWLQDNPLGMILASISGVLVLLALAMAIVGSLPVSVETELAEAETAADNEVNMTARQIGTLNEYQVVNEKPVFNESRTPVLGEIDEELSEDDTAIEVKDAPDVRLTGIVITPGMKIASLTPADGNLETVMAHEGDALTGEFVGWQVTAINPRTVVLESRDGQSLELDLQVHDAKIQEPVVPVVAPISAQLSNAQALAGKVSEGTGEDDEPLSRAEQIRQRIAERRAELRQEQEAQQPQTQSQAESPGSRSKTKDYQSAIREMMKNKSKDQGDNDKTDG
jgi:hypothetical protein